MLARGARRRSLAGALAAVSSAGAVAVASAAVPAFFAACAHVGMERAKTEDATANYRIAADGGFCVKMT